MLEGSAHVPVCEAGQDTTVPLNSVVQLNGAEAKQVLEETDMLLPE